MFATPAKLQARFYTCVLLPFTFTIEAMPENTPAPAEEPGTLTERVVNSYMEAGDLSRLTPEDKRAYYLHMCTRTGLDPIAQPFEYLRLNGKVILYARRGATDQLAAMHKLNREITDGPRVVSMNGKFVMIAVARVTTPAGRVETATGAVNVVDDMANTALKAETKAKRRGTLAILGLGMLDDAELEGLPGAVPMPPDAGEKPAERPARNPAPADDGPVVPTVFPEGAGAFYQDVKALTDAADAAALWRRHGGLGELPKGDRETAFDALAKRARQLDKRIGGKARSWLKEQIAKLAPLEKPATEAPATEGAGA